MSTFLTWQIDVIRNSLLVHKELAIQSNDLQRERQIDEVLKFLKDNSYAGFSIVKPLPHPTEQRFPEMTTRFREIIEEMYKTFLEKNNDYSRWNILATGIVGITTRFWDKTARIMNLVGFNIGTGEYSGPKENMVKDEKIEQTFLDASVYGIIARIYIEGKWGK